MIMTIDSINRPALKNFLLEAYKAVSLLDSSAKLGLVNYSSEEKTFHYACLIENGNFLSERPIPEDHLIPHKKRCLSERREITATYGNASVFNSPIIREDSFMGILSIQGGAHTRDSLELFRIISRLFLHYYEGVSERGRIFQKERELAETTRMLNLVTEISEIIISTTSIDEISRRLYEEMKKNFGECTIGIAVNSPEEERLKQCFYYEYGRRLELDDIHYSRAGISKLLRSVLEKQEIICEDLSSRALSFVVGGTPLASYFSPLTMNDRVIGAFTYQTFERRHFTPIELDLCRKLIPFLTITLNTSIQNTELLETNKKLRYDSSLDPLTRVYTRRHFYKLFERNYRYTPHDEGDVYLMLFDLDNFKGVNDNYGHHQGDAALKKIAETLKGAIPGGMAGRYGGDEFLGGVRGLSEAKAVSLAKTIKKKVDDLQILSDEESRYVGISIGILRISSDQPLRDLFPLVDRNLYRAKDHPEGIYISAGTEAGLGEGVYE